MAIVFGFEAGMAIAACRPDFLCEPGAVLGARAGIIALRAGLCGALFGLAKARQLIFFHAIGRCIFGASGGA